MKSAWMFVFALFCFCRAVLAQEADYSLAYRSAQDTKRMLIISIGVDDPVLATDSNTVYCRLPAGAEHAIEGRTRLLSSHESLRDMEGSGVFAVDFKYEQYFNTIVSVLPRRYCTQRNLKALVELPPGTLTQRTLIWAIRVHPEQPQSTDCPLDQRLVAQATAQCNEQVRRAAQFHWLPLPFGNTSEIVAESWPWNTNIVDGAVELVHSWRQSPGHWNEALNRHVGFGYDMRWGHNRAAGKSVWYGAGAFYR